MSTKETPSQPAGALVSTRGAGDPVAPSLDRRTTARSSPEQALALYRAIFVNSNDAVAIVDADGTYLEQNVAHERLVGYSDDELRGQTPAIHLGEEQFRSIARELQETGRCRRECISRTKDGRDLVIELSSFAVRDATGNALCYVGTKRDVTEQRFAAAELRRKFEELQAVHRMVETVGRAGALDDIYAAALDELQRTLRADRASVLLYDDDGVMRFKAWRGLSDAYRAAAEGHSPWPQDHPDPQPVLVADAYLDPNLSGLRPVFESEGVRALGFIPLVDAGTLLGKFMIYFDEPHEITTEEVQLAQTIASHIAFAITRKRSETALRASEERYRVLADAGALLNSSLDHEETLSSVTRLAVPAIADWCVVDLTDDAGAEPEVVSDASVELLRHIARDESRLDMLRAMRISSFMSVPLVTRGRIFGVIIFAVGQSGRRYTAADLPLAEELARRAALAVDNARLYRDAQEANRAKSQFLAMMSHELRTPLNAIGGYAELLAMGIRGPVSEMQREDITRILRSQQHLLGLINELLAFARIETGHVELNVETLNVEQTLDGLHSLLEPQISVKRLRFTQRPGDPDATCRADRERIRQVLLNLLGNAVKFTPADGAVALEWETTGSSVRFHVRDTGPGIPALMHESIFEPFVQLASERPRIVEGTGLGLAISRELARAMGGDVTVRSAEGSGSTFTLTVPRG